MMREQIEISIRLDKKRKMRRLMFSHLLIRLRYRNGNKNNYNYNNYTIVYLDVFE